MLTQEGYYTVPSLDQLDLMADQKRGKCVVEGFTVVREGYGKIHFLGTTDVYGLNLDQLGTQFIHTYMHAYIHHMHVVSN